MAKKSTAYGRKLARMRQLINSGVTEEIDNRFAAIDALTRCRPFNEPPPHAFMQDVGANGTAALNMINIALHNLLAHQVPPDDSNPYGLLGHAIDVAHIRYIQINPNPNTNPAHQPLINAKAAMHAMLQRRRRTGSWGLAGPERQTLIEAVELYEAVLPLSSPEQMSEATLIRKAALDKGQTWAAVKTQQERAAA